MATTAELTLDTLANDSRMLTQRTNGGSLAVPTRPRLDCTKLANPSQHSVTEYAFRSLSRLLGAIRKGSIVSLATWMQQLADSVDEMWEALLHGRICYELRPGMKTGILSTFSVYRLKGGRFVPSYSI